MTARVLTPYTLLHWAVLATGIAHELLPGTRPVSLLLFGVGLPVLAAYHVAAHVRGTDVVSSPAAAFCFLAASAAWFYLTYVAHSDLASTAPTILLVLGAFVLIVWLVPGDDDE
ncbi:hypothetical protein [Halocalculus aciditolerans]|uniref:Uncharacterized protein n=1 Tax=Halocalculus aciditolerans TaxID=1383812 RepID=A0A830FF88_9EURY|nr:hypothetical protein [Halocalculus aciditolerans]GGL49303.1 hypothetical protein GCM10009039_04350 [Halocalculus aciditolerans]